MSTHIFLSVKWPALFITLLVAAALACNAPVQNRGADGVLPTPVIVTATTTPEDVSEPEPATAPAVIATDTPLVVTVLPTFTPIAQPTLAPTSTPLATASPAPATTAPTATATRPVQGPLSFTYTIDWQLVPGNPFLATARVTITAQGGDGRYTYYRDDLQQPGPVFEYTWATCRANPGSLRVDSGDGQSARVNYFEQPPCPTPTP